MKNKWKVTLIHKGHRLDIILKCAKATEAREKVLHRFPEASILEVVNYTLLENLKMKHLPALDFPF